MCASPGADVTHVALSVLCRCSLSAEFYGPFTVHNLADEAAVVRFFLDHIRKARPHIFVTYNGDFFDWPFLDARASAHGMSLRREIGVVNVGGDTPEYRGRTAAHMVRNDASSNPGPTHITERARAHFCAKITIVAR